jgi:hypothetical protein
MSDRSVRPTQEEISLRAYEIYVSRGRQNGGDIDDWLRTSRTTTQDLRNQEAGANRHRRSPGTNRPAN